LRLFGLEISRAGREKDAGPAMVPAGRSSFWGQVGLFIREPFTGAWQRNEERSLDTAFCDPVLFRVTSMIAGDIAKNCLNLVAEDENGVCIPTTNPAYSPVLNRPNHYQNRIQFLQSWVQSKLSNGNTYVLKQRDGRGVVVKLYVLDPFRVQPLVAPDGSVFYQLRADPLSQLPVGAEYVPASEVIHDRWNTFFHPLVGLSPIFACGLAALQAQEIQKHATRFFRNGSMPGGILTAPGNIDQENADRVKAHWETNFTGSNAGRVAVVGNGMRYEQMGVNALNSQLIEQLKWTGETICGCYGVPPYMAGVGQAPLNNNVEALAQQYYSQCLQIHIESLELCLTEGLSLKAPLYVEMDLDGLLRMDTASLVTTLKEAVNGGLYKPDEARRKLNLAPVKGGDAVYLQQQNFSLEALARRDAKEDPFGKSAPPASTTPSNDPQPAKSFSTGVLHIFDRKAA
jgi:HK97 family phage portal protein